MSMELYVVIASSIAIFLAAAGCAWLVFDFGASASIGYIVGELRRDLDAHLLQDADARRATVVRPQWPRREGRR